MLGWVAAVESTTLLGGVLGWVVLRNVAAFWLAAAVAHAGGGFLFLAAHAVLGEIMKHEKLTVLLSFGTGFCAIGALTFFLHLKD